MDTQLPPIVLANGPEPLCFVQAAFLINGSLCHFREGVKSLDSIETNAAIERLKASVLAVQAKGVG